jgi:hypothetical protein
MAPASQKHLYCAVARKMSLIVRRTPRIAFTSYTYWSHVSQLLRQVFQNLAQPARGARYVAFYIQQNPSKLRTTSQYVTDDAGLINKLIRRTQCQ